MKRKLMVTKRKLNNAGMSLIEILVAMALLVIAIIPLSAGYIYSAKLSAKAKHMQQTSILAHTMIENCKAYDVDEIEDMVNNSTFMPNADAHIWDTSITDGYQFYFDDVVVYADGAGNESSQVYDLSMRIKPIVGMEKNILKYSNMNRYMDAVFLVNQTMDETNSYTADLCDVKAYEYALGKIVTKVNTYGSTLEGFIPLTVETVDESLKSGGTNQGDLVLNRTITGRPEITDSATNAQKADVIYQYTFTYNGTFQFERVDYSGTTHTENVSVATELSTQEYKFPIYSNSVTGSEAEIENIYLFYYPSYNNIGIVFSKDVIQIDNQLDRSFNLYIMKQFRQEMVPSEVSIKETSYEPTVSVTGDLHDIYVFHNLGENLGGGATTAWTETTSAASVYVKWQNLDISGGYDSLVGEIPKQLMYTVEVSVHSSDSYVLRGDGTMGMDNAALASMDGTFLNW